MKKSNFFTFLIIVLISNIFCSTSFSQKSLKKVSTIIFENNSVDLYNFKYKVKRTNDTISIAYAYCGDYSSKKLILFIAGSGAYPLFAQKSDLSYNYLGPKEIFEYTNLYNILIIGKIGIKGTAKYQELNQHRFYVDSTGNIPNEYILNNNLMSYNNCYTNFLNEVNKKYKYKELILVGHSQGARIVAELGNNKNVDKVIYMSADPLGRIATQIDENYSNFKNRNTEKVDFYIDLYSKVNNDIDTLLMKDTYFSWRSFSKPSIIPLSQLKKPTLIIYGDLDENCPNCYSFHSLPKYNNNITVNRFKGLNHRYIDQQGNNKWKEIFSYIINWINQN